MTEAMNDEYISVLTKVCRAVILNEPVPDIILDEKFFELCTEHKLENIVYEGIRRRGYPESEIVELFHDKSNQGILNDAAQQYYFEMVSNAFEENGINYLPMKGMIMKTLYPTSDLRQSSDIDIYVGRENAEKCKSIMEGLGFENKSFGDLHASDNYRADKFSYIELHRRLMNDRRLENDKHPWYNECNKIINRLVHDEGHRYKMTDEDFYIFMVGHIAKHVSFSGSGVRSVLDIWIYLDKYPNMNKEHIDSVFEQCGLTLFHSRLLKLVDFWFNNADADEETLELSRYIAMSGWNGVQEQFESSGVNLLVGANKSKLRLRIAGYLRIAFLPRKYMERKYENLKKHPHLLPYYYVKRAIDVIMHRHESIHSVIHSHDNVDMEEAYKINQFRKSLGL